MPLHTIQDLTDAVNKFRDDRNWRAYHKKYPKDMAMAIVTEAAEVVEHFRFKNGDVLDEYIASHKEEIGDELADVLYGVIALSSDLGIDMGEAVEKKFVKSAKKYPIT